MLVLGGGLLAVLFMGQKASDTISNSPRQLVIAGQHYWQQQQFDSAYQAFREAQRLADSTKDLKMWAMATQLSGMFLSRQMKLAEAAATLDSVIAISDQLDSLNKDAFFARRERAYVDMMRNDFEAAQDRYEALVADYEAHPPSFDSLKAEAFDALGQAYAYGGKYQEGLQSSLRALQLYESIFDQDNIAIAICLNTVAIMQMYMNQYEGALESFQRSLDILTLLLGEEHTDLVQIRTNIGVLYGELGLFWESLSYHRQNLAHLNRLPPSPHLNGLLNMGATLVTVGEYEEALRYLDEAESFLNQHPNMTPSHYAALDHQRSIVSKELGNMDESLLFAQHAIDQSKKIIGNEHPDLIPILFQLGAIQLEVEQFEEAERTFQQALDIANRRLGPKSLRKGHAFYYLGETESAQQNWKQALIFYDAALTAYEANGNQMDQAKVLAASASMWLELGHWDSTLLMHEEAWERLWPDIPFQLEPDSVILAHWSNHASMDVLESQAQNLLTHYQKNQQTPILLAALTCYERMMAIADSQLIYFQSTESRTYWRKESLPHVEAALRMAEQLFRLTGETQFVHRAFQLAENSKSGNLRLHLRGQQAMQFAGIPDSLVQKERFFQQRLLALTEEVQQEEKGSPTVETVKRDRFDMQEAYREYRQTLEEEYPHYFRLKYPLNTISLADIQAMLRPSEAMYSYFWGEKNIFIFRILDQEISMYHLDMEESFVQDLNHWIRFISSPPSHQKMDMDSLAGIGAKLCHRLLPGLHREIQSLSLIPHGILGYLPVESLLTEVPRNNLMRNWPFLAKNWSTSYAYAAELWLQQRQSPKTASVQYLGFAPRFEKEIPEDERAGLGRLLYNEEEVETSAQLLNGHALVGQKAQESVVKNLEQGTFILHFATHAIVDEEELMRSRLYLSPDTANKEDGVLYASEIYGLALQSPLTILSACQTGSGTLERGEGIMSLARAFQYAGSGQILTTLWRADDRSGAQLSIDFLKGIAEGSAPGSAIHHARNKWLEESDTYHCHPYFWAAYILIGNGGESIPFRSHLWIWGLSVLLGLVLVFVFYRLFIWHSNLS
ncbi:MAG: CHAT domain-containing tetratricopeptide repeat protein [Bacteroidota bacterium]